MNIFNDNEKVHKIVDGAYKKLKSYYYYNNTLSYMKEKISEFEYDEDAFNSSLDSISDILCHPLSTKSKQKVSSLIGNIDYIVLPKAFDKANSNPNVITNSTIDKCKLNQVNFFINAPIELHILDLVWCIYLGYFCNECNIISNDAYAYIFDRYLFSTNTDILDIVNNSKNKVFNNYFEKYSSWKNNALNHVNNRYSSGKSSFLISLDIESCFYSIRFDFNFLNKKLASTSYHDICYLTSIIRNTYEKYTSLISKVRLDTKNMVNKVILPIGLLSSGVLANIYLSDFDNIIRKNVKPIYYGRYVDDMLLVLEANDDVQTDNIDSTILNSFVSKKVIIKKSNNEYGIQSRKELTLQKKKIKIFYISSNSPKSILELLSNEIEQRSSISNIIPDMDDSFLFNRKAYQLNNQDDPDIKFSNIEFLNQDKYKAIKYLTDSLWKYHNVKDSTINKNEMKQIELFFGRNISLELYDSWIKVFTFYLISANKEEFQTFYQKTLHNINTLTTDSLIYIKRSKLNAVMSRLKNSLKIYLKIAISSATALDMKFINSRNNSNIVELAKKFRKANMFNHHYMAYPAINFTDLSKDITVSYLNTNIEYYSTKLDFLLKDSTSIFNLFSISYSPRFIHLEEFFIITFIYKFNKSKNAIRDNLINKYYEIVMNNNVRSESKPFDYEIVDKNFLDTNYIIKSYSFNSYYYKKIKPNKFELSSKKDNLIIAIANVQFGKNELENQILGKNNNTFAKKRELYNILHACIKSNADAIIMPELFVPIEWIAELAQFSRKTQKLLIFGVSYLRTKSSLHNFIVTIVPSRPISGFKYASIFFREKNNYSPIESLDLAKYHVTCADNPKPMYFLFHWLGIDFTTFNCFELTDITARSFFKSKIDVLFSVEYNKDTNYFSSVVDSTARDLHCFIVQSNVPIYGDYRITAPMKSEKKDLVKIKGGENTTILISTIKIKDLNKFQADYKNDLKANIKTCLHCNRSKRCIKIHLYENCKKLKRDKSFKPFPANFNDSRSMNKDS